MKKTTLLFLVIVLASCAQQVAPALTQVSTMVASATLAEVAAVVPTETPTNTVVPPTGTVTIMPQVTATLQPPATCPEPSKKARLSLAPVFKDKKATFHDTRTAILGFLNEGGDPKTAVEKLSEYSVYASLLDVTHDGVPEVILPSGYLSIFGCQNGQYTNLLEIPPSENGMTAVPLIIQDLNQNGLMELLVGHAEGRELASYQLYEWDGRQFSNLLPAKFQSINIYIKDQKIYTVGQSNSEKGKLDGNWEIVDTDGNGLKDIVIRAGVYSDFFESSDLEKSVILKWDGKSYAVARFSTEARPTPSPTFTPLPFSATCDYRVPELRFQKPEFDKAEKTIADYLNAGGNPEQFKGFYNATIQDLNNDTAPEIILIDTHAYEPYIMMFACKDGKYVKLDVFSNDGGSFQISIMALKDNNKNGFPEVFVEDIGCFYMRCGALYVIEWNGEQFVHKIRDLDFRGETYDYTRIDEPNDAYLSDLDSDGIAELIWTGEVTPDWHGDHWAFYPQRMATHVFKWDGMNYTAQLVEYSAPHFRFEAIQDGDRYSKAGLYEKALKSYQLAVSSNSLKWWTKDLYNYTIAPYGIGPCAGNISACPYPTSDPNERPVLSAYALFRKMIVHLLMNDSVRAEATYQQLLTTYTAETPGFKITAMATTFWNEYQSSHAISGACARALSKIRTQSDVLLYLTGGYNGLQGIGYQSDPSQVCPFK